jgi:hypothetical protein
MQPIKDSFYVALRDRLAALNPARTVTVLGVTRPAVLVSENLLADSAPLLPEAFYLSWREVSTESPMQRLDLPLLRLACEITYWTQGTDALSSQDRGRTLAQLDSELMSIATPRNAPLADHSQSPALALDTNIFWTAPQLAAPVELGNKMTRVASLQVFAHAEAAQ